jgi:hypothetical protein
LGGGTGADARSRLRGQAYIVKEQWLVFDGNRLHFTFPFEGERLSLIFFVVSHVDKAPSEVRDVLYESGFDFEWDWHRVRSVSDLLKLSCGVLDRSDRVHA